MTTPVAITVVVLLAVVIARPREEFDNSFAILVILAASVISITWGVYLIGGTP